MKIQFEDNLPHQNKAINSVINLFSNCIAPQQDNAVNPSIYNINKLEENLKYIQEQNNITIKDNFYITQSINHLHMVHQEQQVPNLHFAIEMETGTGKTYVYIKTILQLADKYDFKKFIIIVPNIAVRNGVIQTLDSTSEHFKKIYKKSYHYFEYDSSKPTQAINFADSPNIEICIVNTQSFNSANNKINQLADNTYGKTPIEYIAQTKPILIIDEPQVNLGEQTQKYLKEFNPLFKIEYSATLPKNNANLLYVYNPIDAYRDGLVKQIEVQEVALAKANMQYNNAYIYVQDIILKNNSIEVKLKLQPKDSTKLKLFTLKSGDSLQSKTLNQEYKDLYISGINQDFVEISPIGKIKKGEQYGNDMQEPLQETRIEKTIEKHLEKLKYFKEQKLNIKVLSLFFIDKVDNYRGENPKFKIMFEKAYNKLINSSEFKILNMPQANEVQGAYFSQDNKGNYKDSKDSIGKNQEDKRAFELIMKDKTKLLSTNEPTQFIFSHSALSVGWDNPNVFQICTLNETQSYKKKRQEIGRGLRLPLNASGERIQNKSINVLSIIANESYKDFASALQKKLKDEWNIDFIENYIKNANENKKHKITLKQNWQDTPHFKELWERLKHKTKYNVNIDVSSFIKSCIKKINNNDDLKNYQNKITTQTHLIDSLDNLQNAKITQSSTSFVKQNYSITNMIDKIVGDTNLSKKTLLSIIRGINEDILNNLFKNPNYLLSIIKNIISAELTECCINGIKYTKINNQEFQLQEVFQNEELLGDFVELKKSIYNGFIADSQIEKNFVNNIDCGEININTKLFIKLPKKFYINTPYGKYSPDFALYLDLQDKSKTYLIVETKGSTQEKDLRVIENHKINCAKEHFKIIDIDFKLKN